MHIDAFLQTAIDAARQAGALILDAGSTFHVDYKSSTDPVTDVDRAAETLIVDLIRTAWPDHSINAEEGSGHQNGQALEWLVDPIDGTTNFAHGLPVFSVSIALRHGDDLLAGVVYAPAQDECFSASRGGGAWLNGRRLQVSSVDRLERAFLATGFPYDLRRNGNNNLTEFAQFHRRCLAIRRLGSAAIDLAYVAAGRYDGYWELRLNPWDVGAGMLLVQEAGGIVTSYDGNPATPYTSDIVVSNRLIHDEMLTVLREGDDAPLPAS